VAAPTFKARLEPSGREFPLRTDESILNCALRERIALQYGCRNGRCSSCKYLLIEGDVDFGKVSPYSLSESEKEEGWALLCQARALSDLVIRDLDATERDDATVITPREITTAVIALDRLNGRLWKLQLLLAEPLTFYPGQFIELEVPDQVGNWRCYSIASSPINSDRIELVVKQIEGGAFSGRIENLKRGHGLTVRGPYGMNYLRNNERPVLLVATGSGIAPMLSILRAAAEQDDPRTFQFYYGARIESDLIYLSELHLIESRMAHFSFKPTLSAPRTDVHWRGNVGRVTLALQREIHDASPYDVYICGQPEMCESVATLLLAKGLPENRIFRDDFYAAV
jgi:NAD(P)H-flavin reductase/ferredoxin